MVTKGTGYELKEIQLLYSIISEVFCIREQIEQISYLLLYLSYNSIMITYRDTIIASYFCHVY